MIKNWLRTKKGIKKGSKKRPKKNQDSYNRQKRLNSNPKMYKKLRMSLLFYIVEDVFGTQNKDGLPFGK